MVTNIGRRWDIEITTSAPTEDGTGVLTAHSNVERLFERLPYGLADLDPTFAPSLVEVQVSAGAATDAVTDSGLASLGLPTSFPLDSDGVVIDHSACQPIGQSAFNQGLDGVAARSAATGGRQSPIWSFPDRDC